jgi:hypothetical protein
MQGGSNPPFEPNQGEIVDVYAYVNEIYRRLINMFSRNGYQRIASHAPDQNGVFEIVFESFALTYFYNGTNIGFANVELSERMLEDEEGDALMTINFAHYKTGFPGFDAEEIYQTGELNSPFYGNNTMFRSKWCNV